MKKIFLILILGLLLTSCFWWKWDVESSDKIKKDTVKVENKKNALTLITENDIRNKTEYTVNFSWLQSMYFNDSQNIWLLLSYFWNMEYQWILEKKEKEYAKIIVEMWEEFIKQDKENIDKWAKEISNLKLSKLLRVIWQNYEKLWKNDLAIEYYNQSAETNLNNYKVLIDLWNIYINNHKQNKALKSFKEAKEIIKNNKIIKKINKDFEKYDTNFWWYTDLGIIYKLYWKNKKSKESFQAAIDILKNSWDHINKYEKNKLLINLDKLSK